MMTRAVAGRRDATGHRARGRCTLPLLLAGLLATTMVQAEEPAVPAAAPPPMVAAAPVAAAPRAPDRLELDPTSIRGNQELPKVLYIVPWKEPGPAQPDGRPLGSLVDEALAPVDREVFRRQMRYFDQLYAGPGDGPGAAERQSE
ncbi:MAG: hypothetical protein QY320_12040 [Gammaproteobacteria bacterium]|nr:MAG: hypothetical protein QY320_12040 [Gammaproteobacteria bacterium]